jgi:hypothetical protein
MFTNAPFNKVPEFYIDLSLNSIDFGFKNGLFFAVDVSTFKNSAYTTPIYGGTYEISTIKYKNVCDVLMDTYFK